MSEIRHRAGTAGGLDAVHHPVCPGKEPLKIGRQRGVVEARGGGQNSGRERWTVGPRMPLVPSLLRGPAGPTPAGPSPGNQAEQKGASQYWPGSRGEPGWRGKAVSSSSWALGVGTDFWHCPHSLYTVYIGRTRRCSTRA